MTNRATCAKCEQQLQQFTAKEAEHFIYANEKKIDSATTSGNEALCFQKAFFFKSYLIFLSCQEVADPDGYDLLL